ncbi:MAG TPA: hemerythrin domain-containing protein [Verrucomicrobiota bacterium]|nr:hemerythrin domain-containing protein [Verrucomicrobiota bacterium]HQL79278.1 hemerythrin domain-containing protein [Verrucomicrobiota bacterium]
MISITRALSAEHRMFEALFDEVEELLGGFNQLAEVKRMARLVEGMLRQHAKVEDDLLLFAGGLARADLRRSEQCRHEHQEIDSRLTRIHSARTVGEARTLLRGALAASRRHLKNEDRKVFPILEAAMEPEALAKLGTVWFLRRHAPARWTL